MGKLKKALSNVMAAIMVISLLPTTAITAQAADVNSGQSTGPRSATVANSSSKNNVFLGNDKLELGINEFGTFGSTVTSPSNFHPWSGASGYIGMRTYDTDNSSWTTTADFFLPGAVDEGFLFAWSTSSGVAATQQGYAQSSGRGSATSSNYSGYSTTDQSTTSELKAVTTGTLNSAISYTQTVSFAADAGVAGVQIQLTNTTSSPLYNVEYIRAFDPDQGVAKGAYDTNNYFYKDSDGTLWAIASTNSTPSGSVSFEDYTAAATYPFFYMVPASNDYTVTPVSQGVGWSSLNSFVNVTEDSTNSMGYRIGYSRYDDQGMGIRYNVPKLDAGQSITLVYNMSLDSDIASAISLLKGGNLALQPESYVVNVGDTVNLGVDMATLFSGAASDTTYDYQWYNCATEDGTYSVIGGATSDTYSAPTTAAGTSYYKCIVTPSTGSPVTTGLARVVVLEATATLYEIKFDANTTGTIANMPGTQTVKSGDKVLEPTALVREGYTLAGWYTEAACTNMWNFDSSPTSNMTLFAKWVLTPTPTVSLSNGKISVTHGDAASGQNMNSYTMQYSPDNGANWYAYVSDGSGLDFTDFASAGYSGTTAEVLFRQTSTIDGISGIVSTTSATTMYKVSQSVPADDSIFGDVTLTVTGAGATSATAIGSMGNAFPSGTSLTYTIARNSADTSNYFAGINGDKNYTGLNGTFTPGADGKYIGGTYVFTSLSAAQSSEFYFGNWESELADAFTDATNSKAVDLKAAIGESGSEQRGIFEVLFPDVSLTTYDSLTDKDQVLMQYVENSATDSAAKIVSDLLNRNADSSKSVLENFAETQSELEGNPTYPEVAISNDGVALVTLPDSVTNPVITVKDSSGNEITAASLYHYNISGLISDTPNNYITVQVTDATVNYNVKVRVYVNTSTYKLEENCADLDPAVGGTLGVNTDNAGEDEAALDNITRVSDKIYTAQSIQWKGLGDNAWNDGNLQEGLPYKTALTVDAEDGSYFIGFRYGNDTTLYTPDNVGEFRAICGDSSATIAKSTNGSTDPAEWTYTLVYTPKNDQTITAQFRNLLGELNEATTTEQIQSVISDSNYAVVMHDATGSQFNSSSDLTGEVAKDTYGSLDDTSKVTVLAKILSGVSERDGGYTITEFNNALYWTSMLQKLLNDGLAKVEGAYTTGSWEELQSVLSNAKTEYDAAGNTADISTAHEKELCKQLQAALDQLTLKTLAVEIITNADGITNSVSIDAENPSVSGITAFAGQNGYAFPVYGTKVIASVVTGAEYDVEYIVDGVTMDDISDVNDALESVTDHTQVKIFFTKKTVNVTLPGAGVVNITADADTNTDGLQANINEDVTLRVVPGDGQIIIPGGIVEYTVGGAVHSVGVNSDGTFDINASDDIVITDISAALKDLHTSSLNQLLDAVKSNYDSDTDTVYNTTDLNWTQESWENLFGADNEGGTYGGVYADVLAVAQNASATDEELQEAVAALTAATNALKPQYTLTLADGFAVQDGGQTGLVEIDDIWYVAKGTSVVLDVTVPEGKDLNQVSYFMGGQTLYAWASDGAVTIYGVSDSVNNLSMDVTDSGFSGTPTTGGIGAAVGVESNGNTYTLTPDEGNELVSITVDGLESRVPADYELSGIVQAAYSEDYTDGDKGVVTIVINGRSVQFTKYNVEDSENGIPAGTIVGTPPGIGQVQITVEDDVVTATVIAAGSTGYKADTVIKITTDGTDSHEIIDVEVQPKGTGYVIDFSTPTDGAAVTWAKQNTGSHSITAVTTLKTYSVNIEQDGAEPPANVGGITANASSVKYGGTVILTIPAPAAIDGVAQEVSMDSTVAFTVGGESYSDTLLALNAADNGISVVINSDGSAKLTITDISGNVDVTAATVNSVGTGTNKATQGLDADKMLFALKLTALQNAITEGNRVKDNVGNIYDETTVEWTALTNVSTGEIKGKTDIYSNLSAIDLDTITSEENLIAALENKLGVESGTKTLAELFAMIETATNELIDATNAAKILASNVVSIPENTQYQGGISVDGLTDKGNVVTYPENCVAANVINTISGADIVISGIKTDAGYLPIVTFTVSGADGSSYNIIMRIAKDGDDFKAQIAITDVDGNITGWNDTSDVIINCDIDSTTKEGTFDITIENGKLISVLGEDTSEPVDGVNDRLGNITDIFIDTYGVGREMSTAKEILDSTAVGGYMGVSQVSVDTANDGMLDFMAGDLQLDQNITPLVTDGDTASISFTFTEDVYAKGSNLWYKELYGIVIDGVAYEIGDDGQFPADSGLTYTKTPISGDALKYSEGKVEIDTSVFNGELTGIKLLCRPTNSQYTTFVSDCEEVNNEIDQLLQDTVDNVDSMTDDELLDYLGIDDIDSLSSGDKYYDDLYEDADSDEETPMTPLIGSALTDKLKDLAREKALGEANFSNLNADQIETVLKLIKRLNAQIGGTYSEEPEGGINEYYLTEENEDYLTSEIEQLKMYLRKLNVLGGVKDFSDAVNELYQEAVSDGLDFPLSSPLSDDEKAIITKLTDDIEDLEKQYNDLSDYEVTQIDDETENQYNELLDAVEMAQEDVLTTDVEIFNALVNTIDDMITGDSPYSIDYPDLVVKRISQADDLYDDMSNDDKAEVGVKKSLVDELKDKLDDYLNAQAEEFAMNWLTTDYTGTSDDPGSTEYSNDNRLDSEQDKNGYTYRVSLAKDNYNELPSCVKAAVDELFNSPTVPQLYKNTFPSMSDMLDVDDETAAENFINDYLTKNDSVITEATKDNYEKILDAEGAWDKLTLDVQTEVNRILTEDYNGKTYPALLARAESIDDAISGADSDAQEFIDNYLRYNGSVITNANKSNYRTILNAVDEWDDLDSAVQDAVDELLTDTYKGMTYDELYKAARQIRKKIDSSSGDTSGGTGTTSSGTVAQETNASPVIVDGISYSIGTQETINGITTVTPDQVKLSDKLEEASEGGKVIIPITEDVDAYASVAALNLKNIEDMAEKSIILTIQDSMASYDLPTVDIDAAEILDELGATDPEDVLVEISIINSDEEIQTEVADDVESLGAAIIVPPMEFKVTASYGGKTVEVTRFSNYVSRTVEITEEQARKITTAVVYEADGSLRHVPTYVYQKDGKWYAEINSCTNSVYVLIYNEVSFPDAKGKWYEESVNEMGSRKIISGRDNGNFDGDANITRAEFAVILINALGLPADGDVSVFTDVQKGQWYYGAVGKAYEYGLISGKTSTTFDPMARITREEAMQMISNAARTLNFAGSYGDLTDFSDANDVGTWALNGVKFNVGSGLIVGNNGKLSPKTYITRAESATVILRLLQKAEMVDIR